MNSTPSRKIPFECAARLCYFSWELDDRQEAGRYGIFVTKEVLRNLIPGCSKRLRGEGA
jgi:hypothetical protein